MINKSLGAKPKLRKLTCVLNEIEFIDQLIQDQLVDKYTCVFDYKMGSLFKNKKIKRKL